MASITVKVSTQQLESAANQFDASRTRCENLVKKMMNTCTGLKGSWEGKAAATYYNKLAQISGDLRDVSNIINEQSKDLREIKRVYESDENTVDNTVGRLNPDVLQF